MYDLFISYRRDGGYELARLLYTSFKEAGLNPFFDVEELRSGPFDEKLYTYIEESQNFVLVCSPGCLERCSNEGDWVKLEIAKALSLNKNIVPVMMKNFAFPDNLPEEIEPLKMFNGASINQEYFNASIEKIISLLVNVSPKKAAKIGIEEKKHIEELYNHAMELLGQQSFVQATACFEEIRDIHPGYVRAYWGQLLAMYRCMSNAELVLNTAEDFNENPLLASALAMAGENDHRIYSDVVNRRCKNCQKKALEALNAAEYDNCIKYAKLVIQKEPANEEAWWMRFLAENRVQNESELFKLCTSIEVKYKQSVSYKNLMEVASENKKEELRKFDERVEKAIANKKLNQQRESCREFIEGKLSRQKALIKELKTSASKKLKEQSVSINSIKRTKGKFFNNNFFTFLLSIFVYVAGYALVNTMLTVTVGGKTSTICLIVFGGLMLLDILIRMKKSLSQSKSIRKAIASFDKLDSEIVQILKDYRKNEKIKKQMQEIYDQYLEDKEIDKEGIDSIKERINQLV